ncbi:hypothetical protein GCM10022222_64600 [Amycolatopsis ultiminotia]|uniref:Uncharacterized protein n=1 Tax=Amycolatopsis ultiminotia TaxID=543629 RepID=A0ABP6XSZ3_9PSEU
MAAKQWCAYRGTPLGVLPTGEALHAGTDLRDGMTVRRSAALRPIPVSTRGLVAA